jgi:4-diphosphocytidyl-2C-methyl-D-erythritol kinase
MPERARFNRSAKGGSALAPLSMARLFNNSRDFCSMESMLCNSLEDVVTAEKPVIGRIIERLAHTLDKKAIVSGSGPSVFCLYPTRKEAMEAKKKLFRGMNAGEKKRWKVFIAGTS